MNFFDHLEELRNRVIKCLISVFITFVICYFFRFEIFLILKKPILEALPPESANLNYTGLIEPFWVYLKVAFV